MWPDFVCHFSLFRGVLPAQSGFLLSKNCSWSTNDQILQVVQKSPTRWNPNLNFLKASAASDTSNGSISELEKFGFNSHDWNSSGPSNDHVQSSMRNSKFQSRNEAPHIQFGSLNFGDFKSSFDIGQGIKDTSKSKGIMFGSFSKPVMLDQPLQKTFVNEIFFLKLCANQPAVTLEDILDFRQARYSDAEIMEAVNLHILPPSDLIFKFLGRCSRCSLSDHLVTDCPGICLGCQGLDCKCVSCRPTSGHTKPKPNTQIWRPKQ